MQFEEYQPLEVGAVVTSAVIVFASLGRTVVPDAAVRPEVLPTLTVCKLSLVLMMLSK